MKSRNQFGSSYEAIIYPVLLLIVMWLVYWGDHIFELVDFYKFGVKPKTVEGLKGVLLMPLIHSKKEFGHIINNSLPTFILLAAVIYYYRQIALRVFVFSWLFSGLGVWLFAGNVNSYHIGMSGVVYALAGFLFTSGALRKYKPLQAISLFVVFVYGSMVWGIFPIQPQVSWQGHLFGLITGVSLAFIYRRLGPQPPKYLFEIEKELGIEPPDLEGQWREKMERLEQERIEKEQLEKENSQNDSPKIVIHYVPKKDSDKGG